MTRFLQLIAHIKDQKPEVRSNTHEELTKASLQKHTEMPCDHFSYLQCSKQNRHTREGRSCDKTTEI